MDTAVAADSAMGAASGGTDATSVTDGADTTGGSSAAAEACDAEGAAEEPRDIELPTAREDEERTTIHGSDAVTGGRFSLQLPATIEPGASVYVPDVLLRAEPQDGEAEDGRKRRSS